MEGHEVTQRAPDHEPHDPGCELCQAEKITEWVYEDSACWVAECYNCRVPMMVFKPHREPDAGERDRMIAIAKRLYPEAHLRFWRGRIPDHFHFHCDFW